ncbi:MAG: AAA family ATPase, partial [Armatimonadetes bacterium]|nr:AAA family ATPase [Armatimonadota bacterium]
MIQSVKIERLRGIREGELNDLTPLTILVGGNGSGKSTVLEALYIGANKNPAYAIAESVSRRMDFPGNHRWLIWKEGREGNANVDIRKSEGD